MGRRAKAVLSGDLGPVLKRWVSGAILPISGRLRSALESRRDGRVEEVAGLLGSPVFGVPADFASSKPLGAIAAWSLKGSNLDDFVLTTMGTAVTRCATSKDNSTVLLTPLLTACADACRQTAIGQFITQVQGAKAMMRVRTSGKAAWKQGKQMDAIALMMGGQVRGQLVRAEEDSEEALEVGGKKVLSVMTTAGDLRQITMRVPSGGDWDLLEVARVPAGMKDPHLAAWVSFVMLVLCAAQAEAGWFDLVEVLPTESRKADAVRRGLRRRSKGLTLSGPAHEAIKGDLEKWMAMGFTYDPMTIPPILGDYLTVKHRPVTGSRGPHGIKTDAKDSAAWHTAAEVMAGTAWTVHGELLRGYLESDLVKSLVDTDEPDEMRRAAVLNAHRVLAAEPELYLPIFMDFRGRVYTRPNLVTYQGRDLQKALLVFPDQGRWGTAGEANPSSTKIRAVVRHMAVCYGGPDKLDKAPFIERLEWYNSGAVQHAIFHAMNGDWDAAPLVDILTVADEPLQLLTALTLHRPGQLNRMACHIDGTCNGLQHLTALFRDATAAPFVNLARVHPGAIGGADGPADIYAEVSRLVAERLGVLVRGGLGVSTGHGAPPGWAHRCLHHVRLDRKLCKKPVMVLPYGGTRVTIEDAVLSAMTESVGDPSVWLEGGGYADWDAGNYGAFRGRPIGEHPLFRLDARRLGEVVWECITAVLPKPMAAMATLRTIGRAVGGRTLEWSSGWGTPTYDPLWITQAKAKADRSTLSLKGYQLPGSVRGLSLRAGRDEIDPLAHTTGIVANFIHSNDAAHLAATMHGFYSEGGRGFGAIHDAYISRPSQMDLLGRCTRRAFAERYGRLDPLGQAVVLYEPNGKVAEAFASWYELAEACGASFPDDGTWDPREVLDNEWFFS